MLDAERKDCEFSSDQLGSRKNERAMEMFHAKFGMTRDNALPTKPTRY